MTPAGRRNFILGSLGLLAVIAGLLLLARTRFPGVPVAPEPLAVTGPGRILAAEPIAPLARSNSGRAGEAPALIQVPLDRPAPGRTDAGLRPLADRGVPSGPVDKRENAGPNAGREMEIISYAFETLEEDVRGCLEQWESSAPGEAAEVMIAFEIDANGLQKSWLEHETEVPFGPRTCLANEVYGLDWSKIVDHPAKLTQRFELGRPDAGVRADETRSPHP